MKDEPIRGDLSAEAIRVGEARSGTARPRGTDAARVEAVVVTEALRGRGTADDPCRTVTQYWSFDGMFLAEHDPETLRRLS